MSKQKTRLIAFSLVVISLTGCSNNTLSTQKAEKIPSDPDFNHPIAQMSVDEISNEFKSNSITAEDKYIGKVVEISGAIRSIDDSLFSEKSVSIVIGSEDEYGFASVSCSTKRSNPAVRELQRGTRVLVRGIVKSEEMGLGMKECKFYDVSNDRWIGNSPPRNSSVNQPVSTEIVPVSGARESGGKSGQYVQISSITNSTPPGLKIALASLTYDDGDTLTAKFRVYCPSKQIRPTEYTLTASDGTIKEEGEWWKESFAPKYRSESELVQMTCSD